MNVKLRLRSRFNLEMTFWYRTHIQKILSLRRTSSEKPLSYSSYSLFTDFQLSITIQKTNVWASLIIDFLWKKKKQKKTRNSSKVFLPLSHFASLSRGHIIYVLFSFDTNSKYFITMSCIFEWVWTRSTMVFQNFVDVFFCIRYTYAPVKVSAYII